tara:strand:- start:111 stop:1157 length:1047 start_codon:yes stop_codon:yes gene_type:complete
MFKIKNRIIGKQFKPFIIAEMSANHNKSLITALKIVREAAKCGVDAIKLQTYTADTITFKSKRKEFKISSKESLWKGKTLHSLYKESYTPWEWHKRIFEEAKKNNILCFSSPFDDTAVDFLEKLNNPIYKVASSECVDLDLIKKIAKTKKPIIISTGMASKKEISEAIECAKVNGCKNLAILKCTSTYPAPVNEVNLNTIEDMRKEFKCEVGLSDHTLGIGVPLVAISKGATLIEKHFTLSRKIKSPDSIFSSEPSEFKQLVKESKNIRSSLGSIRYGPSPQEKKSLIFRRSLYVVKEMKKNEIFNKTNIKSIRPALGLKTINLERIIGKKASKNIKKGTPLKWSLIK